MKMKLKNIEVGSFFYRHKFCKSIDEIPKRGHCSHFYSILYTYNINGYFVMAFIPKSIKIK